MITESRAAAVASSGEPSPGSLGLFGPDGWVSGLLLGCELRTWPVCFIPVASWKALAATAWAS